MKSRVPEYLTDGSNHPGRVARLGDIEHPPPAPLETSERMKPAIEAMPGTTYGRAFYQGAAKRNSPQKELPLSGSQDMPICLSHRSEI